MNRGNETHLKKTLTQVCWVALWWFGREVSQISVTDKCTGVFYCINVNIRPWQGPWGCSIKTTWNRTLMYCILSPTITIFYPIVNIHYNWSIFTQLLTSLFVILSDRVIDDLNPVLTFTRREVESLLHFVEEEPDPLDSVQPQEDMETVLRKACAKFPHLITKVTLTQLHIHFYDHEYKYGSLNTVHKIIDTIKYKLRNQSCKNDFKKWGIGAEPQKHISPYV